MIRSLYSNPSSATSPEQKRLGTGEQVLRQRVSIGDHWLDSALEVSIMAHVILRCLQEAEGLVEVLFKRIKESNLAVTPRSGGGPEVNLLKVARDRLIDYLKSQLRIVQEELVSLQEAAVI